MKTRSLFYIATLKKLSSLFALFIALMSLGISVQTASAAKSLSVSGNLAFGNVAVNTTAQRSFVITNTGNITIQISSISYPAGFTGSFAGSIHSGSSQTIVVTFAPTAVQAYSGTVTVNSDATGPNTLPISGNGTGRSISLSGNLTYGGVPVGSTQIQTLTISNPGNSNLTVTS